MFRSLLLALLAGVVLPARVHAQQPESPAASAEAPAPLLTVQAFLWNTTPVALQTSLVLGGGLEARYRLGGHGLFVGARLAAGEASGATADWTLTQVHMLASLAGGIEGRFGVGLMHAQLSVGTLGIRQIGQRQQYDRLAADNIPGLNRNGWSWGPLVTLEVGVAVVFYDPWSVFLELGPGFTVQNVEGSKVPRLLLNSILGVGYAF
jgi:hypothetical protein